MNQTLALLNAIQQVSDSITELRQDVAMMQEAMSAPRKIIYENGKPTGVETPYGVQVIVRDKAGKVIGLEGMH